MKITDVEICGMHNITFQKFHVKEDLTYLYGPNGAGKSTILEAIELAILGYIPGCSKTKQAIMNHANGASMSVAVYFDDNTSIKREYIRHGSSVSSEVITDPEDLDIDNFVGDLELPVFNFSQFLSMSANEQKKWFLDFLPSETETDINWKEDMIKYVSSNPVDTDYVQDKLKEFDTLMNSYTGSNIDKFKKLNSRIKEYISYERGNVSALQNTSNNLVHYSDSILSTLTPDELNVKLSSLENKKTEISKKISSMTMVDSLKSDMDMYSTMSDSFEEDEEYIKLSREKKQDESKISEIENYLVENRSQADDLCLKKSEFTEKIDKKYDEINSLASKLNGIPKKISSAGKGKCPYTMQECKEILNIEDTNLKNRSELNKQMDSILKEVDEMKLRVKPIDNEYVEIQDLISNMNRKLVELKNDIVYIDSKLDDISRKYADRDAINLKYSEFLKTHGILDSDTLENLKYQLDDIDSDIEETNDILAKLSANEQYNSLYDKCLHDIMISNEHINILTAWEKYTGANGIQNRLSNEPFLNLADNISDYLKIMFDDDDVAGYFNLEEKSNSFEFGIVQDNSKIAFSSLSSGEKCMYMIALLYCILEDSSNQFKFMCIDDSFDNLDEEHMMNVIEFCKLFNDVQFLFAGVKQVADKHKNIVTTIRG